jgi:hypothetical protein
LRRLLTLCVNAALEPESNEEESDMGKLLGFAAGIAAVVITAPASAGTPEEAFVGIPNANPAVGFSGQPAPGFAGSGANFGVGIHVGAGDWHSGDHRFNRRHGGGTSSNGIWVNGGQWALHNNQSFKSDSYNDWWHDQPWRSQPAWVRNNTACRAYWSGGGWRC